ncbi:hypothetical protein K438DRAFT_1754729 [Mycena galopus ATCC 62051]|nr:hypothetical protein K438DRAFT_1754729 [Mycena galopus ATCC 62051]
MYLDLIVVLPTARVPPRGKRYRGIILVWRWRFAEYTGKIASAPTSDYGHLEIAAQSTALWKGNGCSSPFISITIVEGEMQSPPSSYARRRGGGAQRRVGNERDEIQKGNGIDGPDAQNEYLGIVTIPVQDGWTDGRTDNRPVPSLACWSSQHAVPSPDGSEDGRPVHRKTEDGRMILVSVLVGHHL